MGCGSSKAVAVHPQTSKKSPQLEKHGNGERSVLQDKNSERREPPGEPSGRNEDNSKQTSPKQNVSASDTAPAILDETDVAANQPREENIEVENHQPGRRSPADGKENAGPESSESNEVPSQQSGFERVEEKNDENNNTVYVEPEVFQPKEDKVILPQKETTATTNSSVNPELSTDANNNTVDPMTDESHFTSEKTAKILKKEDLYQDISAFKDVDDHALKAPKDPSLSIQEVADYLITPFETELLKLRAIWRWVTANIEYDVDSFFGKKDEIEEKEDPFASRKGVCDGYSTIANELFSLCGIECVKVRGWAKGYYYTPGKSIGDTAPNHSWNAVKIQNQWWLMDTTWGAGYVGQDRKFVWDYTEHYFLTDPKEFIFDHFPTDPQWQLLEDTAEMEEYESWAKFSKYFFIYKLKALSYKIGTIDVPMGSIDISFEYEEETDFTVDLIHDITGKSMKNCCFHFSSAGIVRFLVKLPQPDVYTLKLFAKKASSETKQYDSICNYRLRCSAAATNWTPFPSFTGSWKGGFILHEPLSGTLQQNTDVKFKLAAPENIVEMFVCVCGEETWLNMTKGEGDVWEVSVTLQDTATGIKVLADDVNNSSGGYAVLLNYTVS